MVLGGEKFCGSLQKKQISEDFFLREQLSRKYRLTIAVLC